MGNPRFAVPESAPRILWAIAMFTLGVIFVFSFFGNAGIVGVGLLRISQLAVGRVAFFMPLLLLLGGGVLLGGRQCRLSAVMSILVVLTVAISGIFGIVASASRLSMLDLGGWIGLGVGTLLVKAFEIWVSALILAAVVGGCLVVAWLFVDHERPEGSDFADIAGKGIKKIFEPRFDIKTIEQESKTKQPVAGDEGAKEKSEAKKKQESVFALSGDYAFPPMDLLEEEKGSPNAGDVKAYAAVIKKTLQNFDIPVELAEVNVGPAVAQYAIKPAEGVKLSRITALQADLSLALAAHPIRIEAPIPGKSLVGIEIPNKNRATVRLRGLMEGEQFRDHRSQLFLALGRDVSGSPVYADLAKMPHMLVAGATGSGKTIGLNNIILSLMYRNSPYTLRLILVDPKRVEFPVYNDLPHLLTPVILDTQKTINALKWLIKEMERRFQVLSEARFRDIGSYHAMIAERLKAGKGTEDIEPMPYIVVVIDELADLMASRGKEIEGMVVRLAQMARAIGIHLVLATQRPSVEVITGLIKANITARVAFQVASQIDSRTILDSAGAEKLLGQGDMLFISSEYSKPKRIQGAYVSDKDVKRAVTWIAESNEHLAREEFDDGLSQSVEDGLHDMEMDDGSGDPMYEEARRVVIESRRASASLLQRRLKLGYARAARLLDMLEAKGVVGRGDGAKPREVFVAGETQEGLRREEGGEGAGEWTAPRI